MTDVARATFHALDPKGNRTGFPIEVHFNPASLQLTLSNQLDQDKGGKEKKQYVKESTGKLSMDLVFDTTDTGMNVRFYTGEVAQLMEPVPESAKPKAKNVPSVVLFEWGAFAFQGIIESYKETIEFFSAEGVPLRASVNLTLAEQKKVFDLHQSDQPQGTAVFVPPDDAFSAASRAGDGRAAGPIAAMNGLETLRFPSGPLLVDASVTLRGPAAFASGSLTAGAGAGMGGGLSLGGGAGLSVGGGASFGAGASFGGSASAGVSASAGAFAGLRTDASAKAGIGSLDTSAFISGSQSVNLVTGGGARFSVGGRAAVQGSAGIAADVNVDPSLPARLRFEP